jgi:hypothetical protein
LLRRERKCAMPAYFKIDKERRLVMSTGAGVFTMTDALAHQENLLKNPDFEPNFSQLMDLTHITEVDLTSEDLRTLSQRSIFSRDSRRAILVNSDVVFGLARMFEALREYYGEEGIRVFRNLDDALEWVLAKNTAT